MKKIAIDIAIDSFAAESIDIAIAIENFWGDNWYCHWQKNSTIAHVCYRVLEILKSESQWNPPNSTESELELKLQFHYWSWNWGITKTNSKELEYGIVNWPQFFSKHWALLM